MIHRSTLAALLLLAPALALAATEQVDLDKGKGTVEFKAVGRPKALKINGKGATPHGKLEVVGKEVHGTITTDLKDIDTGIGLRNKHMKEKYLELEKYPECKLTITKMTLPGELKDGASFDDVPFTGKLAVHGQEHPVEGKAKVSMKGSEANFESSFGLKIADWGIAEPGFAGVTMAQDVTVIAQATAPVSTSK